VGVHLAFWVTLGFALAERVAATWDKTELKEITAPWTVQRLPELPTIGGVSLGETVGEVLTGLLSIGGRRSMARSGWRRATVHGGRKVVQGHVHDRFVHACIGVFGAVLGDPARSDGEGADAQLRHATAQQRPAIAGRQIGSSRRHNDAIRNADTRSEQLAKAGGLAADLGRIGHANVAERWDGCRAHCGALDVAAAIAARRIQSMSSAASSTDEPR
jgi:hypothetical protein